MTTRWRTALLCSVCVTVWAFGARAQNELTPFQQDVNATIERGLAWFRTQADPNTGSLSSGQVTALAVLAFLERTPGGWRGLSDADRDLMTQALSYSLSIEAGASPGAMLLGPQATSQCYNTSTLIMAITRWRLTGGPDFEVAGVPLTTALRNGVLALVARQSSQGASLGGWGYGVADSAALPGGDSRADGSCTHMVVSALSAAQVIEPDAAEALPRVVSFLDANSNANGSHHYVIGEDWDQRSATLTTAALWSYRLAGVSVTDARLQNSLEWLQGTYTYADHSQHPARREDASDWMLRYHNLYLWLSYKAYRATTLLPEGAEGVLSADDVGGARDPVADGYPEAPRGYYYDFTWWLMSTQRPDGSWFNGGNLPAQVEVDTVMALLLMERSLGGACIDTDGDGPCDPLDNCPEVPNPGQADADGDGAGDLCDNCPNQENFDRGECCVPDPGGEDCDGVDDDCDGLVDEETAGVRCDAGGFGLCAAGRTSCENGVLECVADNAPRSETCDGFDVDCDGVVDESTRNACEACGPLEVDACNGDDDDCDGAVDEAADCPGGDLCVAGGCWPPCDGDGSCPAPAICLDGACVPPCVAQGCPEGERCVLETGLCAPEEDPDDCREAPCPTGQVCFGDACVPDECADVMCPADQMCRNGACVPACGPVSCRFAQRCLDGDCVPDPCFEVACGAGEACVAGVCGDDPCAGVTCEENFICDDGDCVPNPCAQVVCPLGQYCDPTQSPPQCVYPEQHPGPLPGDELPDQGVPDAGPGDAGMGDADEGVAADASASDAGSEIDASPETDATPETDAGAPVNDTGFLGDGSTITGSGAGCACDHTQSRPSPLLWLLCLYPLRRRRSHRR
ncbi:MAG: hypothetical protein ACE366_30095 [Bradymonadia bacterium]